MKRMESSPTLFIMLINPSLFVSTLINNRITANQWLFLLLCGLSEKEKHVAYRIPNHKALKKRVIYKETLVALHYRLISELNGKNGECLPETYITKADIIYLIEKGFIIKKGDNIDTISLTDKGVNVIFGDYSDSFEELWAVYPSDFWQEGKRFPSKTSQLGKDELEILYLNKIKYSKDMHQRIVAIVEQATEQGVINCGIEKFIKNELWNDWYEILISQ